MYSGVDLLSIASCCHPIVDLRDATTIRLPLGFPLHHQEVCLANGCKRNDSCAAVTPFLGCTAQKNHSAFKQTVMLFCIFTNLLNLINLTYPILTHCCHHSLHMWPHERTSPSTPSLDTAAAVILSVALPPQPVITIYYYTSPSTLQLGLDWLIRGINQLEGILSP